MAKKQTKQLILDNALTLFSEKGFNAVSVEQIAESVGIKAPSLYKHYTSKQSIFDAILEEMDHRYKTQVSSMKMTGFDALADVSSFDGIEEELLIQMAQTLFHYFLHDEYVCRFRKMITCEQFQNQSLALLFSRQYFDDPLAYQSTMFRILMQTCCNKQLDYKVMALHFYSPIFILLSLCDREPQREAEADLLLKQHIIQFNSLYFRKEKQ